MRMPFRLSPRLPSFDYVGLYRYSVTICTFRRQRVFLNDACVDLVCTQLRIAAVENDFAIVAYCFMPDHVHLLPEGQTDGSDFLRFMRSFKQRSAFHWKQRYRGQLWQRGYIERVLRDEEDSFKLARYIFENPLRAGLVRVPEEYPYSGSFVMGTGDVLDSIRRT